MMLRTLPLVALLALSACQKDSDDTEFTNTSTQNTTIPTTQDNSPIRSCEVWVQHTSSAAQVSIAGRFNNWEPQPMTSVDGVWRASLGSLIPGIYAHKFVEDEVWEDVPPDVYTAWEGDNENRALKVTDCNLPNLVALDASASADGSVSATFQFT
ncbi:MAG: hypothetical protein GWP91_22960, partial [Rhodobacterales bacterium]|nr:hypothetical protein [Rhodobacterales bacterium]